MAKKTDRTVHHVSVHETGGTLEYEGPSEDVHHRETGGRRRLESIRFAGSGLKVAFRPITLIPHIASI